MRRAIKAILFLVVLVGLAAAVALGIINPRKVANRTMDTVGSVTGGAVSRIERATAGNANNSPACAQACRDTLRRIESAKRAIHSRGGFATGTVSWDAVIKEMGGRKPVCPCGGEYTLGTLEQLPGCSISNGGTPTNSADDHFILRY